MSKSEDNSQLLDKWYDKFGGARAKMGPDAVSALLGIWHTLIDILEVLEKKENPSE